MIFRLGKHFPMAREDSQDQPLVLPGRLRIFKFVLEVLQSVLEMLVDLLSLLVWFQIWQKLANFGYDLVQYLYRDLQ